MPDLIWMKWNKCGMKCSKMIPSELIQAKQTLDSLVDIYSTKYKTSNEWDPKTYEKLKSYLAARGHILRAIDELI